MPTDIRAASLIWISGKGAGAVYKQERPSKAQRRIVVPAVRSAVRLGRRSELNFPAKEPSHETTSKTVHLLRIAVID